MLLYEATVQDGLSVKIPTSERTDMLKQKIKIYQPIKATEKLTVLFKTILITYDEYVSYMKCLKTRNRLNNIETTLPISPVLPCISLPLHSRFLLPNQTLVFPSYSLLVSSSYQTGHNHHCHPQTPMNNGLYGNI
jgi:hypothetical protein